MTDAELRHRMLDWRGVEDPCLKCDGSGVRAYSTTATWRGGIGGTSITSDVCDSCWGSGDRYRTWTNLRRLRDEENKRVAEGALTAVIHSCAADMPRATHSGTGELLLELDKLLDRRRLPMSVFAQSVCCGLRNLIARALGVQERKL